MKLVTKYSTKLFNVTFLIKFQIRNMSFYNHLQYYICIQINFTNKHKNFLFKLGFPKTEFATLKILPCRFKVFLAVLNYGTYYDIKYFEINF